MKEAWLEEKEIFPQAENLYKLKNSKSKLEVAPSQWMVTRGQEVEDE